MEEATPAAMFLGHDAVGFASKKLAPRTSLGWLIAAPLLLDLLWPLFLLLGIERVEIRRGVMKMSPFDFTWYPWSHSLLMAVVWGALLGGFYSAFTRYVRGGIVLFFGVVSHWLFDWIVHRPDLPLYPAGARFGLGLWNNPAATLAIELGLFASGILIYRGMTRPLDRVGSIAMWAFIVFLAAIYAGSAAGNPPPDVRTTAWVTLSLVILPFWAGWFDRHRALRQ